MPKFIIKNRYTDEVKFEIEAESLKDAVEKNRADLHGADLGGADLHGADLGGADLHGADLYGTNLREADLYGAKIKISQKEELLKALHIEIKE